jgi:hypothetical protein
MSLTMTSIRTIAHTSVMAGAPIILIAASHSSQTSLRPLGRNGFSSAVQQEAPKADNRSQKFLARRMRQHHRNEQLSARPVHPQKARKLAIKTYRGGQSSRSWDWSGGCQTVCAVLAGYIYANFFIRFVKLIVRSHVKNQLTLRLQFRG